MVGLSFVCLYFVGLVVSSGSCFRCQNFSTKMQESTSLFLIRLKVSLHTVHAIFFCVISTDFV